MRNVRTGHSFRSPRSHARHPFVHELRVGQALMRIPRANDGGPPGPGLAIIGGLVALVGYIAYRNGSFNEPNLIYFGVLIPSVILHEISHGYLAHVYGDDTAK